MRLFAFVEEGVEFPGVGGGIGFAVGSFVFSCSVIGIHLRDLLLVGLDSMELLMRIGEGGRVPFLTRGLVLLIVLIALTIEGLAGNS